MSFSLKSITRGVIVRPPRILLLGVEKIGKALAVSTPIPTPLGWVLLRDIKVGDSVFDKTGKIVNVTNVTKVMKGRPCFEVKFKDGASLIADAEHQWEVIQLARNTTLVKTTVEIAADLQPLKKDRYHYSVPVAEALEILLDKELPIDPYTLGVWLGDGTSSTNTVTIADRDASIMRSVEHLGARNAHNNCHVYTLAKVKSSLQNLNLLNNKHIPELYFRTSYEQRFALFQGLMDTDGYIADDGKGTCEFTSVTKQLAENFLHLLQTLGMKARLATGKATINGRYICEKYRISFFADLNPFTVKFKADRFKARTSKRKQNKNAIVSIKAVESVPVKCIEVDSPSHTYLAGETYIVTHNSTFCSEAPDPIFLPIKKEEGIDSLDVSSFPTINSFSDLMEALGVLAEGGHTFKTLVIDSASALEHLIWESVCADTGTTSIELAGGGYGKGFSFALDKWKELMDALDYLRDEFNMTVILIGHVKVKTFNDPERASYDQYQFDINEKVSHTLSRWADFIGFANKNIGIVEEKTGFNKKTVKAEDLDTETHYLFTKKTPAHPGGGRGVYGKLPSEIPLHWKDFQEEVDALLKVKKAK